MKGIYRVFALVLVLVLCLGMLAMPASAEQMDEETFKQAVLETAFAYYNKGRPIQYDSTAWTYQNRNDYGSACRLNTGDAPEEGSSDNTVYTVCTDWVYDVFYNAFGYQLMGTMRNCISKNMVALGADDPLVVFKYDPANASVTQEAALKQARDMLQVGDVLVSYGATGHAMLYIGDYKGDGHDYVMHSWGGKFNTDTGADKIETGYKGGEGAIRIDDVDECVFCPGSVKSAVWSLQSDVRASEGTVILRPYADPEFAKCELTESAKTRLKYSGIEINKETNVSCYASVETGDEITVTVTVINNGTQPFMGLTITEPLPHGAILKDAGGAAEADGKLTWTRDVAVGAAINLEYAVTVTATRGGFVTFPRGAVEGIPTRKIALSVRGKKLNAAALEKIDDLTSGYTEIEPEDYAAVSDTDPIAFANLFYKNIIGIDLDFPLNLDDWAANLMEKVAVSALKDETMNGWMWQPKTAVSDAEWARMADMIIPDHLVGFAVYLEGSPTTPRDDWTAVNRVQEYKKENYEPGDVFLALNYPDIQTVTDKANVLVYIYLGGDKVALYNEAQGIELIDFGNTIGCLLNKSIVIGLRPTLAYDDVNTGKLGAKTPFTDVKNTDWFYSFVKDLYHDGTVNGMTATTYQPSGVLTYGQALKLIVCALGYGEQAKTGAHWASGYLALAKEKGWIGDFSEENLDAWISRLSFCQIAAKAKGLTAQPESNPFTDTADEAVLALVKAGVINGMTATTFEPESSLTRAQIAKIIRILRDK